MKAKAIGSLFFLVSSLTALADVRVCNNGSSTVSVAVAYELLYSRCTVTAISGSCWEQPYLESISHGWYNIQPSSCVTPYGASNDAINNREFYITIDRDVSGKVGICTHDFNAYRYAHGEFLKADVSFTPVLVGSDGSYMHPVLGDCSNLQCQPYSSSCSPLDGTIYRYHEYQVTPGSFTINIADFN